MGLFDYIVDTLCNHMLKSRCSIVEICK